MNLDPLFDSVRADMEAWEPWLVLADALDELGDVRAEMIRLTHELATWVGPATHRRQQERQARLHALQEAHEHDWLEGLTVPRRARLHWFCGFVVGLAYRWNAHVLALGEALLQHPTGKLLFALAPECVSLKTVMGPAEASQLFEAPWFARISWLSLRTQPMGARVAQSLVASPYTRGLSALRWGRGLDDASLALLAEAPWPELRALDLRSGQAATPAGWARLGAGMVQQLERLSASFVQLDDQGLAGLLAHRPASLAYLDLAHNTLTRRGMATLAHAGLRSLRQLGLYGNAEVPALAPLRRGLPGSCKIRWKHQHGGWWGWEDWPVPAFVPAW